MTAPATSAPTTTPAAAPAPLTAAQSHAVLEAAELGRYPDGAPCPPGPTEAIAAGLRQRQHPAFAPGAPARVAAPPTGPTGPAIPAPRTTPEEAAARVARAEQAVRDAAAEREREMANAAGRGIAGDLPGQEAPGPTAAPEHPLGRPVEETGLEGTSSADLLIPKLKIKQGTTKGEAFAAIEDGHSFLDVDPAGAVAARVIRLLDVRSERSWLMPMDEDKAENVRANAAKRGIELPAEVTVVCSSPDRVRPVDRGHGVMAATCAECPYTQWRSGQRGKRIKPACGEGYLVLGRDEATGLPFRARFASSAIRAVKGIITQLAMKAATARAAKGPPAPSWAFRITLSSTKETSPQGTPYHAVKLSGLERGTPEEEAEALALRRAVLAMPAPDYHDDETGAGAGADLAGGEE